MKSYEEQLADAEALASKCKESIKIYRDWLGEALKIVPVNTWDRTKRQIEKEKSVDKILERLQYGVAGPERLKRTKDWQEKLIREQQEKLAKEKKQREKEEADAKYQEDAIIYLQSKGKMLGVDFNITTAVNEANQLAFQILVDATKAVMAQEGAYIHFGGDDNCEGCPGWDGHDRRCFCGNRRVYWANDGDFKNPLIYPEVD